MADRFDRFLAEALAPPTGEPDRAFVRAVQTRIALEQRLARERTALWTRLAVQVLALAAVAGGLAWLGRAPMVAGLGIESPAQVLAALLCGFAFLVAVLAAVAPPPPPIRIRL
jgi:hypothetical protein